ncbi:hypothetical protein DICVIV_08130 [Dictyocaulus viviparus]|uniref:Uncharacterized protein n=1 Tax=Dictyocaulus viviparus TaxID=29172 RepID=A0A0D8XTW0_DICVI|nr:hypothetical protein DICVIV_08130 [Dictyocaulus viviparus]
MAVPIREINGVKQLTTIGIPRNDYRFTCRPTKDRMTWYRGWQSLTFKSVSLVFFFSLNLPLFQIATVIFEFVLYL